MLRLMQPVSTCNSCVFLKVFRFSFGPWLPCVVLTLNLATTLPARAASPEQRPLPLSVELQQAIEAYRLCGRLNLPPDFKRVKDATSAASVALNRCSKQRFAVAGQFALDYPGTVRTKSFIDSLTLDLVHELSGWLEDVDAKRVPPQMPPPERHTR